MSTHLHPSYPLRCCIFDLPGPHQRPQSTLWRCAVGAGIQAAHIMGCTPHTQKNNPDANTLCGCVYAWSHDQCRVLDAGCRVQGQGTRAGPAKLRGRHYLSHTVSAFAQGVTIPPKPHTAQKTIMQCMSEKGNSSHGAQYGVACYV